MQNGSACCQVLGIRHFNRSLQCRLTHTHTRIGTCSNDDPQSQLAKVT